MKKVILFFLTLVAISAGVNAQNVTIPDANFKTYLVGNTAINTNGDTEIQVSEASAFTGTIDCPFSNITDLTGIEAFTALTELYCDNNSISSLNFTNNISLVRLNCSFNSLLSLNITNGNNSSFTYFGALFNPNLTCIQVDDVAYSTTNWTNIDAQTSFSTNCSVGLTEFDFKKVSIYPNPVQNNLFIELEDEKITEMSIIDFSGKVVKSIENNVSIIDVSDLQRGVYILKVATEKSVSTQRFIKQ